MLTPVQGVLAAVGVLLCSVLAVAAHLRACRGSPVPAAVLAAIALVTLVPRAAAA